jgi:hypothetical protein
MAKGGMSFDVRSGKIVVCKFLIESHNYQTLTAHARSLMLLLHVHWDGSRSIDYGVREAAKRLNCSEKTARKAFKLLTERGFIICTKQSVFSSRTQSKTRSWKLTWLPYGNEKPLNSWENWNDKN